MHGLLDRETTRPLLDLLGVRSTPSGPGRLLDRLRALARSDKAPAHEIEKWYRRLDQMLDGASTADAQSIKDAFKAEKLILAQDGTWVTSGGVFLVGDEEDVPGAAVIRASVLDLSLWRRIGVAERPSVDLALQWLGTLTSGKALAADDARRVRTLMSRYPTRIWDESRHWVSLAGEWVETDALAYGLSMQSLFTYAFAVKALLGEDVAINASLLYLREPVDLQLDDPEAVLAEIVSYLSAARISLASGAALLGPDTGGDYDDLAFALPANASATYCKRKLPAATERLGEVAHVWEAQ